LYQLQEDDVIQLVQIQIKNPSTTHHMASSIGLYHFSLLHFRNFFSHSALTYGNADRSNAMVQQASFINFIVIISFIVLCNKAECKSGGGHYSSQRTLGSGPTSGGHGMSAANQLQNSMHWSNSWLPMDINAWYEHGT
jgi:hypothetical protein